MEICFWNQRGVDMLSVVFVVEEEEEDAERFDDGAVAADVFLNTDAQYCGITD